MDDLITPREAARILGGSKPIPLSTLCHWRLHGEGPSFIRIGGATIRYSEAEVRRYLDSQRNAEKAVGGGYE